MHGLILVLSAVFAGLFVSDAIELPKKFYGNYILDHSENFNEYLYARGYGWFTRKLLAAAVFKKEFTKSDEPGKFDYVNRAPWKKVHYDGVELGKEFIGEGLDSTKHKVTFDLKGNTLYEKHIPLEDGEAKNEVYEYSFTEKDGKEYLLAKVETNGIVGKRFYKRV